MPALPVLWLYCAVKGTRLVVDWHNYSHTILQVITYKCINDGDEKYFDLQYCEKYFHGCVGRYFTLVGALMMMVVVVAVIKYQ